MPRVSLLLLLIGATIAAAQDKPDFSGNWVLERPADPPSDAARALTVRQTTVARTVIGAAKEPSFAELTVERNFSGGPQSDRCRIGIIGGVTGGVDRAGQFSGSSQAYREYRYAVRWDGNELLIETGYFSGPTGSPGPYTEHIEVWSLDADGRLLITTTDRSSDAKAVTRTLAYRRR